MAIDPIFWDLVGLPENRKAPLSLRANGAWVIHPRPLAEPDIEQDQDADLVASRLVAAANEHLRIVVSSYSLDDFLSACRVPAVGAAHLPAVVATLIAMDRAEEALGICVQAKLQGLCGGYVGPEGTFFDMSSAFIKKMLRNPTRH